MTRTLQTLIDEHAVTLVGRDRERALLGGLAADDRPLVACVHGIAGVGKSSLVRAFAADARAAGARVVALDCGAIEPTERGFLDALGAALGVPLAAPGDLAVVLDGERTILALDGYERLWLLDHWIRQRLVGALPATARLLIAGREAPGAWRRSFGELARFVRLDSLPPAAAQELLARQGVPAAAAVRINRLAHGHPLALQLAASAIAAHPDPAADLAADPLIDGLAEHYLDGLDEPTARALDAASVLRRTTISLLAAVLPEEPPIVAFARLRALPFAELGEHGLVIHDTIREVVAARLRALDPARHRRLRTAAWAQLRRELADAERANLLRYAADMLYLLDAPAVREAFFPTGGGGYVVEPAMPGDLPAIEEIAALHQPAAAVAVMRAWWEAAPETFRVARGRSGAVGAFQIFVERDAIPHRLLATDPVAAAFRERLRADPVPRGRRVVLCRMAAAREPAGVPSPARAALWLGGKRDYLELRPDLRRVYLASSNPDAVLPSLEPVGFAVDGGPEVDLGGLAHTFLVNDFGPGSVDGWLGNVVGRELEAGAEPPLDHERRQLVLDGRRVDLTRLEWETIDYLRGREGRTVERAALLRDVWGHDWTGGSNVLEVVVSALRRKLGDRAGALQTVRGVGYRLDPL